MTQEDDEDDKRKVVGTEDGAADAEDVQNDIDEDDGNGGKAVRQG